MRVLDIGCKAKTRPTMDQIESLLNELERSGVMPQHHVDACPQVVVTVNHVLDIIPLELVEAICQPLTLRDKVALTSCCRALLTRADVASSPSLWAHVVASSEQLGHLCAWLARRRAAVRQLRLAPKQQPVCGRVVASLQHLTLLTHLDLRSCGLEMVPSALCALCSLQRLRLCDNPGLGAWGADADSSVHVPECDAGSPAFRPLRHLTALTRLGMGGCGLVRLPGELSALSSLAHLELPGNQQLGVARGGEGALRPLCHLPSLTRLCLSGCLALRSVPAELKELPSLADLDLACSLEPEEGGEPALEPLRHLSSLTRLAFSRGMVPKRRLPAPLPALAAKGVVEWQY